MSRRRNAGNGKEQAQAERKSRRIRTTRYDPDPEQGLTSQQVQEHRLHGWTNVSVDPPAKTVKEIVHENVFTYFNLIFAVLGLLLCIVGSFRNLTFLPVVVINTLIGIVQEIRAKKVLEKMNMLNAPHARAVRDGKGPEGGHGGAGAGRYRDLWRREPDLRGCSGLLRRGAGKTRDLV